MSDVKVRFDARAIGEVLEDFRDRGKNLRGVFAFIAEEMVASSQELIESEGEGKWPALSDFTLARRRKNGRGAQMLQDTGRLGGSLVAYHGGNFAEAYTNVRYAKYHVFKRHGASSDEWKIVPKRDFLDIDLEEVQNETIRAVTAEIVG